MKRTEEWQNVEIKKKNISREALAFQRELEKVKKEGDIFEKIRIGQLNKK